jgi:predicted nucleic acid-binding protein
MRSGILIDTNVLSELSKPTPSPEVLSWLKTVDRLQTSSIVCYEIARGIEHLKDGRKRRFLEEWFSNLLDVVEVAPVDETVALGAARLERIATQTGRHIEVRDLFILATAAISGNILATRNVADMRGYGVRILDPFTGETTT